MVVFELFERDLLYADGAAPLHSGWWRLVPLGLISPLAIVFGSNQTLWQTKIEPENQGRVFAAQQMFASLASPLAYILAGPLAENVFEPWMTSGSALSNDLGMGSRFRRWARHWVDVCLDGPGENFWYPFPLTSIRVCD